MNIDALWDLGHVFPTGVLVMSVEPASWSRFGDWPNSRPTDSSMLRDAKMGVFDIHSGEDVLIGEASDPCACEDERDHEGDHARFSTTRIEVGIHYVSVLAVILFIFACVAAIELFGEGNRYPAILDKSLHQFLIGESGITKSRRLIIPRSGMTTFSVADKSKRL